MPAQPLVSVIIPVYKTPANLFSACLGSLARQGLGEGDIEGIVVYDGEPSESLRETVTGCRGMVSLREITISVSGVSAARNAGLDAVHGRWVAFLDSDDELMDGALAKMIAFAEANGCDMVFADHVKLYADGGREACRYAEESLCPLESLQDRLRHDVLRPQTACGAVWGKLYSIELAADLRFDEQLEVGEDTLFAATAAHVSRSAGYLHLDVYLYRRGTASTVTLFREDYPERVLAPIKAVRKLVSQWPDADIYEADLDDFALFHLALVLVHHICNPAAPWSGAERRAEYSRVLAMPEFSEPLARADLSVFPATRRVALESMRRGLYPESRAIGWVRQRQICGGKGAKSGR